MVCGAAHELGDAHDWTSVYYMLSFRSTFGRFPTYKDAIAHCTIRKKREWMSAIRRAGGIIQGRGQCTYQSIFARKRSGGTSPR
jgi:hypothetical protein